MTDRGGRAGNVVITLDTAVGTWSWRAPVGATPSGTWGDITALTDGMLPLTEEVLAVADKVAGFKLDTTHQDYVARILWNTRWKTESERRGQENMTAAVGLLDTPLQLCDPTVHEAVAGLIALGETCLHLEGKWQRGTTDEREAVLIAVAMLDGGAATPSGRNALYAAAEQAQGALRAAGGKQRADAIFYDAIMALGWVFEQAGGVVVQGRSTRITETKFTLWVHAIIMPMKIGLIERSTRQVGDFINKVLKDRARRRFGRPVYL